MKILIIGGSGFIGTNLVDALVQDRADFLNLDRQPALDRAHERYRRPCDILDLSGLTDAMHSYEPDQVVHLAADTHAKDDRELRVYRTNTEGTTNVLRAIRATRTVRRTIITSTYYVNRPGHQPQHVRDYRPHTRYGESKAVTEELTWAADLPCTWTIIRPVTIWGPWLYRSMYKAIRKRWYLHPSGAPVIRSWGYVGNVVFQTRRLLELPEHEVHRQVLYVGDEPRDLGEWIDAASMRLSGRPARRGPRSLLKSAALFGDVLRAAGLPAMLHSRKYRNMSDDYPAPVDRTIKMVGPSPYTLETAMDTTAAWLARHHPDIRVDPPEPCLRTSHSDR